MIEYEKKIMLTREEYDFLINRCMTDGSLTRQVNYYYDTDDYDMNDQRITCRIREIGGRYVSTIKAHDFVDGEFNMENSKVVDDQWDDSMFAPLGLKFQGILTTYRTKTNPEYGIEIAVDRNIYLNEYDYELEVEYLDGYKNKALIYIGWFAKLLEQSDVIDDKISFVKRIGKGKSKAERFFDKKRERKMR